jgi:hypothetical protein
MTVVKHDEASNAVLVAFPEDIKSASMIARVVSGLISWWTGMRLRTLLEL